MGGLRRGHMQTQKRKKKRKKKKETYLNIGEKKHLYRLEIFQTKITL
jgi:hypothetical protein